MPNGAGAGGWCLASWDASGTLYVADHDNNVIRKSFAASTVPPALLGSLTVSGEQAAFGLSGAAGLMVDIETSTDLSQWRLVSTWVLDAGTNYCVSPTPIQGAQFFRGHSR